MTEFVTFRLSFLYKLLCVVHLPYFYSGLMFLGSRVVGSEKMGQLILEHLVRCHCDYDSLGPIVLSSLLQGGWFHH
jgi:hypothetical protein